MVRGVLACAMVHFAVRDGRNRRRPVAVGFSKIGRLWAGMFWSRFLSVGQRIAFVMLKYSGERPRILIVRLSAIGDCVLTVPLIHALRNEFPESHLAWIVDERAAPLLDGLEGLDELLVVPRRWHRSLSSVWQIRRALRERRYDIAIDPQSLTKRGLLSFLSGSPDRI